MHLHGHCRLSGTRLQNEAAQIRAEATAMKRRGDFTTPGLDMAAIQAAKV
jgi:hypothetical protein